MTGFKTAENPRFYSDIYGVVIADEPDFDEVKSYSNLGKFAPEVVSRLGNTGLERVVLTSWQHESRDVSRSLGLPFHRTLVVEFRGALEPPIERKFRALKSDQLVRPAPFVWADDFIDDRLREQAELLGEDCLLIAPDQTTGLTQAHLEDIERFAAKHIAK